MTPSEADKIIAEYMGWKKYTGHKLNNDYMISPSGDIRTVHCLRFSQSLDALVPVWEKIHEESLWNIEISSDTIEVWEIEWHHFGVTKVRHDSNLDDPIQQAAAIATAKAIQEITK